VQDHQGVICEVVIGLCRAISMKQQEESGREREGRRTSKLHPLDIMPEESNTPSAPFHLAPRFLTPQHSVDHDTGLWCDVTESQMVTINLPALSVTPVL
jgi:hypothetical protein